MVLCTIQLLSVLLIVYQWRLIVHKMGGKISFLEMLEINFYGSFVESITPSVKAGGEATKALLFKKRLDLPMGKAVAIVGIQKVVSTSVFTMLCALSLIVFTLQAQLSTAHKNVLMIGFFMSILMIFVLLGLIFSPDKLLAFLVKRPWLRRYSRQIHSFFEHFKETVAIFKEDKDVLRKHLFLSTLIWILFPVKAYFIAVVIGIPIHFMGMAVVTYLTYMIGMIPLLPGGLGSFEVAVVFLLQPFHVTLELAMVLAIVLRFVTFWFVFGLSAFYLGGKQIMDNYGKWIPNALTLSNLCLGMGAIMFLFVSPNSLLPAVFILMASILDTLDGKLARQLNAVSDIGKQLDSLSDLVTFGIAPMVLLWQSTLSSLNAIGAVVVFSYVCASAYRLARYNVSKDTSYFMGMPITLAGILTALWYLSDYKTMPLPSAIWTVMLAVAMVSRVKFKRLEDYRVFYEFKHTLVYHKCKREAKKAAR